MKASNFSTVQSLGRSGLIKRFRDYGFYDHESVITGIGDDSAVIKQNEGHVTVITSESMVEGVDFDLTFSPLHHLGFKIVTAAVSDIYAMNALPEAILINLSLPNRFSVEMIDELYQGIKLATNDYGCQVAGGDIGATSGALVVSVTAYGSGEPDKITRRKGFAKGDAVCVSGDLGGALAGLNILLREKKHWVDEDVETMQPDLEPYEYVVKRQLVPIARQDVINALEKNRIIPSAMIDISQGLVTELQNLFSDSEFGAYIYEAALPIHPDTRSVAEELSEDVDQYALYGGEDYELLFTLPEKYVELFVKGFQDFVVIGKVTDEKGSILFQNAEGEVWRLEDKKM
ncbi:MAG: thiamine-phosphate kinase [Balneolales bacterium]